VAWPPPIGSDTEGRQLGHSGLAADALAVRAGRVVGLPLLAGDVGIGGHSALGGGQEGAGLGDLLASEDRRRVKGRDYEVR
jgi:hypothetical protein